MTRTVEPLGGRIGSLVGVPALAAVLMVAALACTPPSPPTQPEAPVISVFQALGAPHVDPALVPLHWATSDPQGDPLTCRFDGDGDGTWDQSFDPCPTDSSRNVAAVEAGSHTARIEVSDGTNTTVATTTYAVAPPTSS